MSTTTTREKPINFRILSIGRFDDGSLLTLNRDTGEPEPMLLRHAAIIEFADKADVQAFAQVMSVDFQAFEFKRLTP